MSSSAEELTLSLELSIKETIKETIRETETQKELNLKDEFDEICNELSSIKESVNSLMIKLRQYKKRVDKVLKDNSIDDDNDTSFVTDETDAKDAKDINEKPSKKKPAKTKEPKQPKQPKEPKEKKPRKKKDDEIQSAILKGSRLSKELCEFLGKPEDIEMMRTDITKEIYKYIQDNNLQDSENKKLIHPNDSLIKLFNIEETQELTYFNIQTFLNKHFITVD